MTQLERSVRVTLPMDETLYLKDPTSSELGRQILAHGVLLIDEIGFEAFTFRKLAQRIGTTEPTVYRYFRNKHGLLLYVTSWYWKQMEYRLLLATSNVVAPAERLRLALRELTHLSATKGSALPIDDVALNRVVIAESSKTYLIRECSEENRSGLYQSYGRVCRAVAGIISEINPEYRYPVALVSTVVEMSRLQKFFAERMPDFTDIKHQSIDSSTTAFLTGMVFRTIEPVP